MKEKKNTFPSYTTLNVETTILHYHLSPLHSYLTPLLATLVFLTCLLLSLISLIHLLYVRLMNFNPAILRSNLMHVKIMEWTNDDALELIEQYRTHTELWNRADPKYKDKLCRFRAWSEIAERFGCSKAEVERKMNVLLTQYRREKHKMLVKLYQGIQPNPSKWYAFKRFDFMEAGGGSSSSSGSNSSVINIMHHHHHLANSGNGGAGANGSSTPLGMVAGGDTDGVGGTNGLLLSTNNTHNSIAGGSNINLTTNGHLHHHHHHSATAVAAAAALNGLAVAGYESATAAAASAMPTTSHHRRMKSKEMKYFGAMGLNLPMLLANSQPLDNWSVVGQYSPSPSLTERQQQQLHVPLSMQFSAPKNNLNSGSGFFSGSSASESPQKPMDTNDEMDGIEEKLDVNENKCERRMGTSPTPTNSHDAITSIPITTSSSNSTTNHHLHHNDGRLGNIANSTPAAGLAGQLSRTDNDNRLKNSNRSCAEGTDNNNGSSPIPNTNMHEAHKQQRHLLSGSSIMTASGGNLTTSQVADDIEIKQELLVDYFHAPHPPAPPDSHRSYSPTDDNRHGSEVADEYAQDLRVSAAAAAVSKGIDFNRFVLPTGLRRSREFLEEKFSPVNMRKLNSGGSNASSAAAVGHMLMNSLLSNENNSEDNSVPLSDRLKSGSTGNGSAAATQDAASSAAAVAAAAFYVESLNKDDCDYVGSNVSVKLRTMDHTQRIIAEKLISEVLFYGQFNELERSARIQPK